MNLLRLELRAFGSFSGVALDFSSAPRGLNVIFGANEAGKSTALRAVTALLFGVDKETRDAHLHENTKLRIAGTLGRGDERLRIVRRKGNKNTLLDDDEAVLDEQLLTGWLGGVDRATFRLGFGLDHPTLREGGDALLSGRGDVGESLFSAGFGGRAVRDLLDKLESEKERIFKPRASTPALNGAIAGFLEAKRTQERGITAGDWQERRELEQRTTLELGTLRGELGARELELRRAKRVERTLPSLARRRDLVAKRRAMGEVVALPESAPRDRSESLARRDGAVAEVKRLEGEVEQVRSRRAAIVIPEALLAEESAVKSLQLELGSHDKEARDLPRVQGERGVKERAALAELQRLGRGSSLEGARALHVDVATEARVLLLSSQRGVLDERVRATSVHRDVGRRQLESQLDKREKLGEERDLSSLEEALRRVRKLGDLEAEIEKSAKEVARCEWLASSSLSSLGLWSGALTSLVELPVPSHETVDRFGAAWERLASRERKLDDEEAALLVRERANARDRRRQESGGDVPSESDLDAARARRAAGWRLVRSAWLDGSDVSAQANEWAEGEPLERAFEESIERADGVADRLRREAGRVEQRTAAFTQHEEQRLARAELETARASLSGERDLLIEEWRALWAGMGIAPLSPTEMRAWIDHHDKAAEKARRLFVAREEHAALRARAEASEVELRSQVLRMVDADEVRAAKGLAELVERCEALHRRVEREQRKRTQLDESIAQLEAEVARAEVELDGNARALEAWQGEWTIAVAPIGLSVAASPEEANAVLSSLRELRQHLDEADDLDRRVRGMEHNAKRLADTVQRLSLEVAPDLVGRPFREAGDALVARLQSGREERTTCRELDEQLAEKLLRLAEARERARVEDLELERLLRVASVTNLAELELAEEAAAEARRIESELRLEEQRLLGLGDGLDVAELEREAEAVDCDGLPSRIQELEREVVALDARRSTVEQELGAARDRLREMSRGTDQAAQSSSALHQQLAKVRALTDAFLRPLIARELLVREIETFRERHQGPLLRRASELFERLTLGRYVKLKQGYGGADDEPVLRCVRRSGGSETEVGVEALSEGARDQLYLALRLASLERHLERDATPPLLLDDVLIQFDDQRAAAALSVLADLGTRTQVLLFTHHARLLALARDAVPSPALSVIELAAPNELRVIAGG